MLISNTRISKTGIENRELGNGIIPSPIIMSPNHVPVSIKVAFCQRFVMKSGVQSCCQSPHVAIRVLNVATGTISCSWLFNSNLIFLDT